MKSSVLFDLEKSYGMPGHPIAYADSNKIYKYYGGLLTHNEIKNFLATKDVYTLFKQYKKLKRNPTYSHFKLHQLQLDLIDVSRLAPHQNQGVKYLLTAIDSFSRKAYVYPIKNKQGETVLTAFKKFLKQTKKRPYCVYSDKGKEFDNKIWNGFLDQQKIKRYYAYTTDHAAIVERFNYTFQKLLYKYMFEHETRRYLDVIDSLLLTYNNRYHSTIKMTPNEAELEQNAYLVRLNAQDRIIKLFKNKYKPKFTKGQHVRIRNWDKQFKRGYERQSTKEIFKIKSVIKSYPKPIYMLKDSENQDIKGYFYEFELTLVK